MANEAELKEKRRQYYLANKERIKEYEKKRKANMTEEEKEAKRAYFRDYYKKKKGGVVNERKRKVVVEKPYNPKPVGTSKKNLHFDGQPDYVTVVRYPNGIYVIGATTEIESMEYDVDKLLYKLKRYIEKNLEEKVSKEQRIVIVDKFDLSIYVEVYEGNEKNILLIINELDNFCKKTIKKLASQFVF